MLALRAVAEAYGGSGLGLLNPFAKGDSTTSVGTVVSTTQKDAAAVGSGLSGLAKLEGELTSATFWKRIGVGALGVGLAITGIILFVVTSKTGEKTIGTAAEAV